MDTETTKTIYKPWGKEIWLELNDKYCYKRIYINAGHRTSFQYHEKKVETNFIISGEAEIWLENDKGVIEKTIMKTGEFFNVYPPKKHRIVALTDIILQEVSTPEVDDIIRMEDDSHRMNGRLDYEHKRPSMCIVTAGKGSRLDKLSENFHKGLLPINNKAVISHIIEKTPKECDIVIAIGYNGDLIKQYCSITHSNRNITYVEVDNIDGEGSGPGYSLFQCKEHLMRPFYFIAVDCLIKDDFPLLDSNWLGVSKTSIPELYATVDVNADGIITSLKNKSNIGYEDAFVGLCGILDFDVFWKNLEENLDTGEMVSAFYDLEDYNSMFAKRLDWYDVGTVDNYVRAEQAFSDGEQYGIPKNSDEVIYKINNTFVKYRSDEKTVSQIVERSKTLKGIVPPIINHDTNMYQYGWVDGVTLYDKDNINDFVCFLDWAKKNMWKTEDVNIDKLCQKFYKGKTTDRVELLLNNRSDLYKGEFLINKVKCESVSNILEKINWKYFNSTTVTKIFHGDFHFDNVVIDSLGNFTLIDWRPNFGDSVEYGDIYYDLSKLYCGILMSFQDMKSDDSVNLVIDGNEVTFSYSLSDELTNFIPLYEKWITDNNYDLDKVKIISALIYLNISPLHSKKFGDMLFFKSLYMLNELYTDKKFPLI